MSKSKNRKNKNAKNAKSKKREHQKFVRQCTAVVEIDGVAWTLTFTVCDFHNDYGVKAECYMGSADMTSVAVELIHDDGITASELIPGLVDILRQIQPEVKKDYDALYA